MSVNEKDDEKILLVTRNSLQIFKYDNCINFIGKFEFNSLVYATFSVQYFLFIYLLNNLCFFRMIVLKYIALHQTEKY